MVVAVGLLVPAVAGAALMMRVSHSDNGQRIFLHGTNASGQVVQNSHGMEGVGCAMCHGPDGRGGMMHGIPAPNITFAVLSDPAGHEHEFSNRRHPAFTRETIKAAVVAGIDPAGNTLDEEMPRWIGLNGEDLEDLIDYLQALSKPSRRPPRGPERM